MSNELTALMLPFETGALPPLPSGRTVFLRAEADAALAPLKSTLVCEQGFRPAFNALVAAGLDARPEVAETGFDHALMLISKHKAVALADLARAHAMLKPGGVLVAAGRGDAGGHAIAKTAAKAFPEVAQASKHHCRVFWLRRGEATPPVLAEWLAAADFRHVAAIDAVSAPGVFGWDKIDKGSALLAESLDARIVGRVADFGAGWGYLSRELLKRCPGIAKLDVVEAEQAALAAARRNLAGREDVAIAFRWHDVAVEPGLGLYDWVITNPPFHEGKADDPDLGRAFIKAARRALAPKGRMLLVANRHLPYEPAISAAFRAQRCVAETPAFKVIEALA
jgi:16S rRNA (guanine1207-N2)-methyltransferase